VIIKSTYRDTISKGIKTLFFMPYLMIVLLCLSFGCCKNEQAPKEEEKKEDASKENDSIREDMKKKDVYLRKTKAQYVIY